MEQWRVKRVWRRDLARGPMWYARILGPEGSEVKRALGRVWTKKTTAPAGYLTKRMARKAADQIRDELARATGAERSVAGTTFGQACDEWIRHGETERALEPTTLRGYRADVRTLKAEFGEHLPLERLTAQRIEAFKTKLLSRSKPPSRRTIAKYLTSLHGICARAERVFGLPANPVDDVERLPVQRSNKIRYLELEEVEAVRRAIHRKPAYGAEQDSVLVLTAAMTGLRWNELRQLRWADVDFTHALVHVRHQTKSKRARSVPMVDQVAAALDRLSRRERWTTPSDYVFVTEIGSAVDYSKQTKAFRKARAKAHVRPVRFHDLRHTFGTHAVRTNPVTDVKEWMGHSDIQTTMIYVHYVPQHAAAARLGEAFSTTPAEPAPLPTP